MMKNMFGIKSIRFCTFGAYENHSDLYPDLKVRAVDYCTFGAEKIFYAL